MTRYLVLLWLLASICGCGGGGGGGGTGGTDPGAAHTQATKAILTLSTQGVLPPGTAIAGVGITVTLPPGVTVATDAAGGVAGEVIVGSGETAAKAAVTADLVPSTSTSPGALHIVLASTETAGFHTGVFAVVSCDIGAGSQPKETDFSVSGFRGVDLHGMTITTLSPNFSVEIH